LLISNYLNNSFQRHNSITTKQANANKLSQFRLRPLSKDTLTITFKGQKPQSLKTTKDKLEAKLKPLEDELFKASLSDIKSNNQVLTALNICKIFENANKKAIKLDINSRIYLNKAKEVFQLSADTNNKENLINATVFLMTEAYEHFGKKAQKTFEKILLPLARNSVTDLSYEQAISFYRYQDKHQDKDYKKLLELTDKLHSIKDINSDEYRSTRQQLLQQEFTIYYQEVFDTDNYLDRAIKMFALYSLPDDRQKAKVKLQESSLDGLRCVIYIAKKLDAKANTIPYDELAEKVFDLINKYDNSDKFKIIKNNAFDLFRKIYKDLNPQNQAKVIQLAVQKDKIEFIQKHVNKSDPIFAQLRKDYLKKYHSSDVSTEDKKTALVNLARLNEPSVKKLIIQVLNDSESDHSLQLSAVWAAGCYPTKANKELLLLIIEPEKPVDKANTSEEELELKEMALYSLAEYKDKSVDEILNKIIKSKSELSELASELIAVRKHSIDEVKDYFIKAYSLSPEMQKQYEKLRNQFVPDFDSLSQEAKNWIDKALIPFSIILQDLNKEGLKLFVINDLTTTIDKESTAKREGYGFFWDNAPALADYSGIIINEKVFDVPPNRDFVFGHEFGHKLLAYLYDHKPAIYDKVEKLYDKAKQEKSFMDYYSAITVGEYFAQANEAFLSIYKSHSSIIKSNDYDSSTTNTKYTLRRKDPELFKILNKMYGKFAKVPVNTK